MKNLKKISDTQAFEEVMSFLKKVASDIEMTQKEFEEQKQQARDALDSLIKSIPIR